MPIRKKPEGVTWTAKNKQPKILPFPPNIIRKAKERRIQTREAGELYKALGLSYAEALAAQKFRVESEYPGAPAQWIEKIAKAALKEMRIKE